MHENARYVESANATSYDWLGTLRPMASEVYDGPATIEKLAALCRRRGIVFPASDIYGGVGSTYDYGHYGVLMRNNVKDEWWRAMLQERDDIVAIDSAIIQNPRVWEASGHVAGFSDPLVDCRTCKKRYRADDLEHARCERKPSKLPGEGPECDLTDAREFNLMTDYPSGAAFPVRISVSRSTSTSSRTLRPPDFCRRATSSARRMSIFPCRSRRW